MLLAIIGFGSKTMGQGNCGNALEIYPQDSLISQSINATDSVFWLKFTATDTAFYFNLVKSDTSALTSIYLYHAGNGCNNYTLITSSVNKVYIKNENLQLNNVYFVKITQNKSLSYSLFYSTKTSELGISAGLSPSSLNSYLYYLYPSPIQKKILTVCENESFWLRPVVQINMPDPPTMFKFSMIIYDANGFVISSSIQPLDYNINNLSCSFSISTPGIYYVDLVMWDINVSNPQFQGSGTNTNPNYSYFPSYKFYINVLDDNPNSNILNVPAAKTCVGSFLELYNQNVSGASFNFGNLDVQQGLNGTIYTYCPCPGIYPLSASVDNDCGVTTTNYNLWVSVKPEIDCRESYCPNTEIQFRGFTCIDNNQNYLQYCSYLWDFGDGTTSNQKNLFHFYTNPGTYYIQFTVTFNNPNTGCNYSETATKIITIHKVEKPQITGNNTNCNKEVTYQLLNNYNIQSFYWGLSFYQIHNPEPGVIIGSSNEPVLNVSWGQNYIDCPLADVIINTIDENECHAVDTLTIFPCCRAGVPEYTYTSVVTFSGTQTLSGNAYIFNENVIIDGDITFYNDYIHMGPNTKIIVNPGAKLTISATTVSFRADCCDNMWDGIYLEDPTSELNIVNNSFIQNAQNAVVARNRAVINLVFSTFRNNYRNVVIENSIITLPYDYSPYPALIRGCTFKGEPNYLLTNLPYAGVQTFSGIETKNILNLTIGEYITDPSYTNYFEKMYCGIKAVNSNLYIYNNIFTDIRVPAGANYGNNGNDPTAIYQPTAIHSVFDGKLKDLSISQIIAGGTGNPYVLNTIDNSINGIYTFNQRVDIIGNTVEAEIYGIRNKDIHNNSRVSNNSVNSTSLFVFTGIEIKNIQPTYANLQVKDNIVFPSSRGIAVSNILAEPRSGQYEVNVYNNHVFFHTNNYGGYYRDRSGIESNNCDGIVISCNEVARLLASEPDFYTNLFGINIVQTMHAQVRDNYNLHKLGAGINVYSDCNYSNYQCNSLKYNYHGFMFNAFSTLSQQGTDLTNSDNYFEGTYWNSTPPTYRKLWSNSSSINGPVNWHVRDNPFPFYSLDNGNTNNPTYALIYEVQNSTSASSACADCSVGSIEEEVQWTKEKREEIFGKTVRNEVVYDTLNTEFTTYDQEMLYRLLKEDSTLMNMGDTSDIAYQQFYALNQNSNIGKIVETQELIKKGKVDEALLRNEAVQDQKLIDYYMKEVNNIYLSTYARSNYQLTAEQIVFLTTVANITPWEGGDAVFIARYMLDIDPNQLTADFAKAPAAMPNSMESRANMAKIYPNPAKDEVMIAFEKATDSQGVLEIYGFTGSVIKSQNLASGYQYISVSVKDLKPGIYFYRILLNNEVVAKDKLLIVK